MDILRQPTQVGRGSQFREETFSPDLPGPPTSRDRWTAREHERTICRVSNVLDELVARLGADQPELHDTLRELVPAVLADIVRSRAIEQEIAQRREPALRAFRALYEQRVGRISAEIEQALEVMETPTLRVAASLFADCHDRQELIARLDHLIEACLEQRLAGARRVLIGMLRNKLGPPASPACIDVLRLATPLEIDGCLRRLEDTRSWQDAVGAILRRVGSNHRS